MEKINPSIKWDILREHFRMTDEEYKDYEVTLELDIDKLFKLVRFFGTKKRYYGVDYDGNELYKGIELVRSDTPLWVKNKLHELFLK